jgi:hypothetical protein
MRNICENFEDFYEGPEMMCIFVSIIVFKKAWEGLFALELNICFVSHGYSIFLSLFIPYLFINFVDFTLAKVMFLHPLKFQLCIDTHGYSLFLSLFIPYLFIYFVDFTLDTEMFFSFYVLLCI